VGFVSKSGGMSNEMYNVIARAADGVYEGALGDLGMAAPWSAALLLCVLSWQRAYPAALKATKGALCNLRLAEQEAHRSCQLCPLSSLLADQSGQIWFRLVGCCRPQASPLAATPSPAQPSPTTACASSTSHRYAAHTRVRIYASMEEGFLLAPKWAHTCFLFCFCLPQVKLIVVLGEIGGEWAAAAASSVVAAGGLGAPCASWDACCRLEALRPCI
jgi:hypothetical protein